jgi:sulfatase modifying factor 1
MRSSARLTHSVVREYLSLDQLRWRTPTVTNIFISYANADLSRVKPLVDALVQRGWSVWWDRTILAGKNWDDVIEAALNDTGCVIVLWSQHSVHSDWVRTEAEEAKRRGILVPALLDDVDIPLSFRRIQAANLVDWSGVLPSAGFDELALAVSAVLSNATPRPLDASAPSASVDSPTTVVESEAQGIGAKKTANVVQARGRRPLLLIGGLALACIAGLIWYFATRRHVSPNRVAALESQNPDRENAAKKAEEERVATKAKADPDAAQKAEEQRLPRAQAKLAPGQIRENPKDGLAYVWIPPGTFTMGCSPGDSQCSDSEKPSHPVSISKGFWMGQTEVTQDAYQKVMGDNPSNFKGAQRPVEQVTWDAASKYCRTVGLRLPTEAEWEYAARAGTVGARYGDLDRVAWYDGNTGHGTKPVGSQRLNAWGLYDMLGNVWEWAADWDGGYKAGKTTDPVGPPSGSGLNRVLRGGSWTSDAVKVRASYRAGIGPWFGSDDTGFRCAGELR